MGLLDTNLPTCQWMIFQSKWRTRNQQIDRLGICFLKCTASQWTYAKKTTNAEIISYKKYFNQDSKTSPRGQERKEAVSSQV